ncbi:nematode cuticle collagen domain protein [Cooperia oncophora]
MKPRSLTCAMIAGFSAVLTVVTATALLFTYIESIEDEMISELKQLKEDTDYIWKEMNLLSESSPLSTRIRRQVLEEIKLEAIQDEDYASSPPSLSYLSCACLFNNSCPPGPPGPAGEEGPDGTDGVDGTDGYDGFDAVPSEPSKITKGCFYCPPGEPGPRGADGVQGESMLCQTIT